MAAEFKIGRLRYTWKGTWTPATAYGRDDVVLNDGKAYICLVTNTSSANFYTDLYDVFPRWLVILDGKTWVGAWTTGHSYGVGHIVSFGGKLYSSIVAHTSTTFLADQANWTEYAEFDGWHPAWTPNTAYGPNDVVKWGGIVYKCTANHLSAATTSLGLEADQPSWTIYYSGVEYKGIWVNGTRYKKNDLVKVDSTVYICTQHHTASSTFASANFTVWVPGQMFDLVWSSGNTYQLGDTVIYGGDAYISKTANNLNNFPNTDTTNWGLFNVGYTVRNTWSSGASYAPGDLVARNGVLYEATARSTGQDPNTSTVTGVYVPAGSSGTTLNVVSTTGIVPGMILNSPGGVNGPSLISGQMVSTVTTTTASALNSTISGTTLTLSGTVTGTFAPGMILSGTGVSTCYIVSGAGTTWTVSLSQTVSATTITGTLNSLVLSKEPDNTLSYGQVITFLGLNSIYWSLLIPGKKWANRWTNLTQYAVGDVVSWANGTYVCVNNHTAAYASPTSTNRPDYDSNGTYWILLIAHDLYNSLNVQGDLRTFKNGKPDVLPITSTSGEIDTYVLGVSTDTPNWRKLHVVPAVYYVDTFNGVDSIHYGVTWDQPWATIRYACDRILQGFYYPNATAVLKANKAFMIAEMYEWMRYQMSQNISPFSTDSLWDGPYAQRDAERIVDAVIYDMQRGGNSQTVAAALSFFYYGSKTQLWNSLVESSVVYYAPALTYLLTLMQTVVNNAAVSVSYQELNSVDSVKVVDQVIDNSLTKEIGTDTEIISLMSVIILALTNKNTYAVPNQNSGISASIYVKTGTYNELLPITVPENVSIIGDELRSAVVQPLKTKTLYCYETIAATDRVVVNDTVGLEDQMRVQFVSPFVNNASTTFGGVTSGQTYYITNESITESSFQIDDAPTFTFTGTTVLNSNILTNVTRITNLQVGMKLAGAGIPNNTYVYSFAQEVNSIATITMCAGNPLANGYVFVAANATVAVVLQTITASGNLVTLTDGIGSMLMYAGDCLKDMFLMRNGTTIRNVSLFGLKGTITAVNEYQTARPTGGAFTALDPGNGPNDTRVWIIRRSPYIQNVTVFGDGCVGKKIDGFIHNGGSKSIVSNDYTMVISDGIGLWCTGPGAITEAISVFTYYCYAGYFAESGGRIRAANGNSSYGTFGVVSEGYDLTEVPVTGNVNNQSLQVQASVTSAFGTTDQLLKLNYSNAGSAYNSSVTNMLKYSNDFLTTWTNDSNVSFSKNNTAPSGYVEAWLLTGSTNTPGSGYIQQTVNINAAGYTYNSLSGVTQEGAPGVGASFNVTITNTSYVVTVNVGGSLYQSGNSIVIAGSALGGQDSINDLTIVVGDLAGTAISTIASVSGTVPNGSSQAYTLSLYVYAGTASSVDLQAVFSGTTTVTSGISYNVSSNTVTPYSGTSITNGANGGLQPANYGVQKSLVAGWYRIWMSVSDSTGVNNALTFKFLPQGANNPIANSYSIIYGAQLEISGSNPKPEFYLETTTNRFTAYANYEVVGAGANALLSGDENRSLAVFNSRITTDSNGFTGGAGYATSANTAQDGNSNSIKLASTDQGIYNYLGMRVFVQSGTGAGQYGFISYYNNGALADSNGVAGKTALVLKESVEPVSIITSTFSATAANNLLTLASGTDVSSWYVNQPVQFIPTFYSTTATATSIDTVTAISTLGGTVNTITMDNVAPLEINMPVTFTGSGFNLTAGYEYYIVDVDYVGNTIQLSTELSGNPIQLSTVESGSMPMTYPRYSGYIKAPTVNMVPNIDIQFTGVSLGGIALGTVYYINDVIDANNFTIATNKITLTSLSSIGGSTNTIQANTASLVPMNPIVFSGTIFDAALSPGTTYYISKIIDAGNFNITDAIIRTTATSTEFGTNLITMASVTDFVSGQPIIFSGIRSGQTFGNISPEVTYYILTINTLSKQITISADKTNTFTLTDDFGLIQARTCPSPLSLGAGTGSMILTSTGTRYVVTNSVGNVSTMNGTFSTSLFGGLNSYTVYYITALTAGATPTLSISETLAGTTKTLSTGAGNMQMAASGWDNINPGTASVTLDSTSAYFIEPKTVFTAPQYSQTSGTVATPLTGGATFKRISWGGNYFVAIPTTGTRGASSSDGLTWNAITLPSTVTSWQDITYGNSYWAAIGNTASGYAIAYSNSNGSGWRTTSLPLESTWSKIVYGNGTFVAISSDNSNAAYSTNQARTWTATNLPSSTTITLPASGSAQLSATQVRFGLTSLYLNGTLSYFTIASDARLALNAEDYAIEFWFRRTTSPGTTQVLFDMRSGTGSSQPYIYLNGSYQVIVGLNGNATAMNSALFTATVDTWYHLAVTRTSGTVKIFVNGTQYGANYTDSGVHAQTAVVVGASQVTLGTLFTGYIDEIRVSRGNSRYTNTGFTPPSAQLTADQWTVLLMHFDGTAGSQVLTSTLGTWTALTYGAGLFVALNTNGQTAWSPDGVTWTLSTAPLGSTTLSNVTITGGGGTFSCTTTGTQLLVGQAITISGANVGNGTVTNGVWYISATNGKSSFTLSLFYATAIAGTSPIPTGAGTTTGLTFTVGAPAYTDIAFGNNKFVAIQSGTGLRSAYSFDGVNWQQSLNYTSATSLSYGQGVFVAVNSSSTAARVSEHGIFWTGRTLTYGSISAIKFGFNSNNLGVFATLTGDGSSSGNATGIYEGARSQARANLSSGVITALNLFEPGSNYTSVPTVKLIDYNVSVNVLLTPRIGSGTLGNPTFVNRGSGYSTTSTVVTITGNGYADTYQTGLNLIVKNLTSLPLVGSNVSIDGNDKVYKVTSATAAYGTTAPFIEATIQLSPEMTNALSPAHDTPVQLRQLYSQCRVTNHDFLLIGTGNKKEANYPYTDPNTAKSQNQAIETNQGHIFYSSTDENGNFAVGGLFGVQQATGTVTLSATQFGLTGLETLSLGGIAVGSSSVVITQFSTDVTFAANSDAIVPTQRATKSYLTGRLSQGGANTFTGNFIAGTVYVGGPNFIKSTVASGFAGSSVKIANKMYITGKGVDGNMAALDMFMRCASHRS